MPKPNRCQRRPAAPDMAITPDISGPILPGQSLYQLEHFAAVLEAIQLQVLAGDNRVAAQNLAKLRAMLEHRAGRYVLVRVDRQPTDIAVFRRKLWKLNHWSKRGQLLQGGM